MNKIRKIKSRATIALCLAILMAIIIAALQCLVRCASGAAPTSRDKATIERLYTYEIREQ